MHMYSHTFIRLYTDDPNRSSSDVGPEVHQLTTSLPITKHCRKDCEKHHMKCSALRQLPKIC